MTVAATPTNPEMIARHGQGRAVDRDLPFLLPVMSRRQAWTYRALVALWAAAVVVFWGWWLRAEHWVTPAGMFINSVMLVWATVLPAYFFTFVHRMRRPNPARAPGLRRVAIIVTKAPSEPWPVVRETLDGMLRQAYPHPYDAWLADEAPAAETLAWCAARGVRVSSRQGVAAYHRPTWPRRTKCKEGNLAYFYDHWGYRDYDIVAQLDADHVPTPGYLRAMTRPFADPTIGYVAAPSICDKNAGASWAARGRLAAEAPFHGALQAGGNGGYAPACIGSHYAVRTAALKQIGGIGPELAEDFSTTLMMAAHGWEGAFALDAEAHGDGPASFADYIVQEFQWSRSLTNVLLRINPRHWGGLTARAKVKLGFGQIWYPLYAAYMLIGWLFPIVALVCHTPWVNVSPVEFVLYSGAPGLVSLALLWWLRRHGWLRPVNARLVAWEGVLFQFTRWPWVVWGVTQAVGGWIARREFAFTVTPKGTTGAKPLPLATIAPYLAISAISAATALAVQHPGDARGYYFFATLNAVTYLAVAAIVVALHVHENRARLTTPIIRSVGRHLAALGATAVPAAAAVALRAETAIRTLVPEPVLASAALLTPSLAEVMQDVRAGLAPHPIAAALVLALLVAWWVLRPQGGRPAPGRGGATGRASAR